ncbi:hypothetical protein PVAP13_1NG173000 [Panicum virgatum]|uniref:Uncharacterized protein n=1 Tax=Panicum virgatum TaxID=38727 RepID=A0A8T0WQQ8_PANVG|nr:hypothetical protein PVAP13_1NG173000 [Panicum virgatum]
MELTGKERLTGSSGKRRWRRGGGVRAQAAAGRDDRAGRRRLGEGCRFWAGSGARRGRGGRSGGDRRCGRGRARRPAAGRVARRGGVGRRSVGGRARWMRAREVGMDHRGGRPGELRRGGLAPWGGRRLGGRARWRRGRGGARMAPAMGKEEWHGGAKFWQPNGVCSRAPGI